MLKHFKMAIGRMVLVFCLLQHHFFASQALAQLPAISSDASSSLQETTPPPPPDGKKKFGATALKIATSLMISTLVSGVVAGGCWPISADMAVAGAGALAFFASEYTANKKTKETLNQLQQDYGASVQLPGISPQHKEFINSLKKKNPNIPTPDDLQLEALEKQKAGYEKLAELAKKKMTFQKAAIAAFAGATIIATVLALKPNPPMVQCSNIPAGLGNPDAPTNVPGRSPLGESLNSPSSSYFKKILQRGIDFLFPPAEAFAIGAIFSRAGIFIKGKIIQLIRFPKNRAILWGVLGGLVAVATAATGKEKKEMERRAQIIEDIIQKYRSQHHGQDFDLDSSSDPSSDIPSNTPDSKKDTENNNDRRTANTTENQRNQTSPFTSSSVGQGPNNFGGGPSCLANPSSKKCIQIPPLSSKQLAEMAKHDPSLPQLALSAARLGNSLNSTGASLAAKNFGRAKRLASQSNRWVRKAKKAKKSLFKHLRRRGGKKAVARLKKLDRNLEGRLLASTAKGLKKSGLNPRALLSPSFGLANKSSGGNSTGRGLGKGGWKKGGWGASGGKGAAGPRGGDGGEEGTLYDLDDDLADDDAPEEVDGENADGAVLPPPKDYEINRDKQRNIFKMIHLRYLKVFGYP